MNRRAILSGVTAVAVGAATIWSLRRTGAARTALEFADLPGLAPFRRLVSGGTVSIADAALAGIDPSAAPDSAADGTALCAALFGPVEPGTLPVAYFSDIRCPACRALEPDLEAALEGLDVRLVRHELPIFGPASDLASRAILAAGPGDVADRLRRRFSRAAFVIDPAYVAAVARSEGLDTPALLARMDDADVSAALETSRALARRLGLAGTPGLVIGRTVIVGRVPRATLDAVIAAERADGRAGC